MSRRIGLTAQAPALLKMVRNRPRQIQKAPPADDAPPLSTDSEDDTASEGTLQADKPGDRAASPKPNASRPRRAPQPPVGSDSDGSADERIQRASIQPSRFSTATRRSARKDSDASTKRRRLSASPERPTPKAKLTPGNHLQNKFGFTSKKQNKATYSKRVTSSQSSQPGSSQGSKKLRMPSSIESPQKKSPSKFIVPGKNMTSSPGGSPRKLLTQLSGDADSSDEDGITAPVKAKIKGRRNKEKLPSPPSPSPPRAVFKLPQAFLDTEGDAELGSGVEDLSELSSDEQSQNDDDNDVGPKLEVPDEFEEPAAAACPWCGEEVDKTLLDDFSKGKRLNVRMQTRFCQSHKQHAAEQTWRDRRYPEIDWDAIEARFVAHREHLLSVVRGTAPSHFRDAHARNVAQGRARAMKKDENLNPGYYGPRGFNAMCDYLVGEFGDVLKRRAVDDVVIAGRGSAAFIQAVLVAELGVRLIMDDLRLPEAEARRVMEESKGLGELVQRETDR